jgi:hypothetical protein
MRRTTVPDALRQTWLRGLSAETRFARQHDGPGSILNVELGKHAGNVIAHGFLGQAKMRGNLRIDPALGDELDQVTLAARFRRPRA